MERSIYFLEANDMKNLSPLKKVGISILIVLLILFYALAVTTLFM